MAVGGGGSGFEACGVERREWAALAGVLHAAAAAAVAEVAAAVALAAEAEAGVMVMLHSSERQVRVPPCYQGSSWVSSH